MARIESKPLLHGDAGQDDSSAMVSHGSDHPICMPDTMTMSTGSSSIGRTWGGASPATDLMRSPASMSNEMQHSYTDLVSLAREADTQGEKEATRNALGTISGVYVPCLLNIIGVILFLRLGWGVGQAGVEGMMLIFMTAELQAALTALSASTIASNGAMRGGGSYYLISRSLGPEFGGAIGVQFYFLYAVGISLYLIGFAEEAQQTWFAHHETAFSKRWTVVLIATLALMVILGIALVGANAFARVNRYLFILQFACVVIGAVFIYTLPPRDLPSGGHFTGVSWQNLRDNFAPHFTNESSVCDEEQPCTLGGVYAIVFPLATGFMEGLNLSGDLQNPGKSIPRGTLAAIGTSCVVYVFLIFTFAAAFPGSTLRTNFSFFQEVSEYEFIVITGVLVSCFSSALGAIFGASRILQAIARDDLFPILKPMSQGSVDGDEPQYAVVFTWLLTQILILIGDLDVIAPICSSFFCLAYAAVNATCFLLQVTGVPNFRPSFRHHSWHFSLLGIVLNLAVMIYLNALYAVVSLLVLASLVMYLYFTAPTMSCGDISQALIYHQVRKYLLRLDTRKAHSKYWRPSILLLTETLDSADVKLCHQLKKGGLYVLGSVVVGDFGPKCNRECGAKFNQWLGTIFDMKLKAIPQIVVAASRREGYRVLMQTSGLGGLQINTVVIPWVDTVAEGADGTSVNSDLHSANGFMGLLMDGIILRKNIMVLRHAGRLDPRLFTRKRSGSLGSSWRKETSVAPTIPAVSSSVQTIDVWLTQDWEDVTMRTHAALMLQFAYVLYSNRSWQQHTRIRLIRVCTCNDAMWLQKERWRLEQLAEQLRVAAFVQDLLVLPCTTSQIRSETSPGPLNRPSWSSASRWLHSMADVVELNKTLQRHSTQAAQLILALPDPQEHASDPMTYLGQLARLTMNLPSTMLVFTTEDDASALISTGI